MKITKKALEAINRFNELTGAGLSNKDAIKELMSEGYRSRNGKIYSIYNLRAISIYSKVPLNQVKESQETPIDPGLLKIAIIDCIKINISDSAKKHDINRETLRLRFKKIYPALYKRKNNIKTKIFFSKTRESGFFERGGYIFDSKYRDFLSRYTLVDNGGGYLKIGNHYYHRVIKNCPKKMTVDHINRNIKDNREINLRVCTRSLNGRNKEAKGCFEIKDRPLLKRFVSKLDGKMKYFLTEKEASDWYRKNHYEQYREFSPYGKNGEIKREGLNGLK